MQNSTALVIALVAAVVIFLILRKFHRVKAIHVMVTNAGISIVVLIGAIVYIQLGKVSDTKNVAVVVAVFASIAFAILYWSFYRLYHHAHKLALILLPLAVVSLVGTIAYITH